MANVIEVLLRTVGAEKAAKDATKVSTALAGIKVAVGAVLASASLRAFIANVTEAEEATNQLDHAYKNTGRTLGLARDRLDDLATELQQTTAISDDAVKSAEALLLTFTNVRGQAFERTIKAAADLSTVLKTDLTGAVRQLGVALQSPTTGMNLLRRAGITFTDSERDLVKSLQESGQLLKAQEVILRAVEQRYGGAAAAARNTLGGALAGLKNAFGDLFEGSVGSTEGFTNAINGLTETISSDDFKQGVDLLLTSVGKLAELLGKTVGLLGRTSGALKDFANESRGAGALVASVLSAFPGGRGLTTLLADDRDSRRRGGRPAGSFQSGHSAIEIETTEAESALQEFRVSVQKIADDVPAVLQQMNENTKTEMERQLSQYRETRAQISALLNEGLISPEVAASRREEAIDTLLPEFDLEKIRALYKPVVSVTSETTDLVKGAWREAGRSIQSSLADMIYEMKFSWRSVVDIIKRAVAEILAVTTIKGAGKALGGIEGGFGEFFAGLFGKAGGGRAGQLDIVGEEGPEVITRPGAQIFNQRQLAAAMGMGGAGNIHYAPSYNVTIVADKADEREARLVQFLQIQRNKDQQELVRKLAKNGIVLR